MCKSPGIGATLDEHDRLVAEKRTESQKLRSRLELLEMLENPTIHSSMKAGCIGEFTITTQQVCPECWSRDEDDRDEECEICNNESDEIGMYDFEVDVPWDTQKKIFKRMCKYYAMALKEEDKA